MTSFSNFWPSLGFILLLQIKISLSTLRTGFIKYTNKINTQEAFQEMNHLEAISQLLFCLWYMYKMYVHTYFISVMLYSNAQWGFMSANITIYKIWQRLRQHQLATAYKLPADLARWASTKSTGSLASLIWMILKRATWLFVFCFFFFPPRP